MDRSSSGALLSGWTDRPAGPRFFQLLAECLFAGPNSPLAGTLKPSDCSAAALGRMIAYTDKKVAAATDMLTQGDDVFQSLTTYFSGREGNSGSLSGLPRRRADEIGMANNRWVISRLNRGIHCGNPHRLGCTSQ